MSRQSISNRGDRPHNLGNEPSPRAARLQLPHAPASESGRVKAWEEPVVIRTYLPSDPDRNPLFLEKRVYQGSSGKVYPLAVIDRVDTEARDHSWNAVHLENEYVRFMVLPQIGGRIHVGFDKINNYDFFYRQNVIKPALVGLAGPWISGGVEFNWPQHHRPATFMPVQISIERETDGAVVVWCSDHDPMSHLKGMHGLCLRPGKAYLELRVRLYNRTEDTQSFLWWANVASRVHERYQSFFPTDVRYVADHAKRAVTEFPLSQGTYYGVDYAGRAEHGVPAEERPAHFIPDGSYPANDLSWYANIPVPTSYMIVGSQGDFAGGYDHAAEAGVIHVSNHHIAPGKKQWTWGNHEFGYAWDRSLTDEDGPYIELMAGAYTDNQPDFSFLAPGETKTFSQFWYPIRRIGVPHMANIHAALAIKRVGGVTHLDLQVTEKFPCSTIQLSSEGRELSLQQLDLNPESPVHLEFTLPAEIINVEVTIECAGESILRYAPSEIIPVPKPAVATEPPLPSEVASSDELCLIGLHLEQYRHATRMPEIYWREAIRRDPYDSRANHALGRWHLRRGQFAEAEVHLRTAIARLTQRNPNPSDGEPHYNLGLVLRLQQRTSEAYDAFFKATWNAAWRGPAYHRLAEIDCMRREWVTALDHIERSLRADTDNLNARNLRAVVLKKLGRIAESETQLADTRQLDPMDIGSRYLQAGILPPNGQQRLDLAFDLIRCGLLEQAGELLSASSPQSKDGSGAMLLYALASVLARVGRSQDSAGAYRAAAAADADYVFPNRLEEMLLLEEAIAFNPDDARALYYLGNLFYDRRRHDEAVSLWERSAILDPVFPTTWRNLGFAYFNIQRDAHKARGAFDRARNLAPGDARILYEQDQLLKRTGELPEIRLATLEGNLDLVSSRDDLTVELATLYNRTGVSHQALQLLLSRKFQPWEGGEGLVLAQFQRAHLLLGQAAISHAQPSQAIEHFRLALEPPHSLGEAMHLLVNSSQIDYWLGVAWEAHGDHERAATHFARAARRAEDFQQMKVQTISENSFWSALSLRRLGESEKAADLFKQIFDYSQTLLQQTPTIDYFATSLPAMLLFDEDLEHRQVVTATFLRAQALIGQDDKAEGFKCVERVLQLDRNHDGAADLIGILKQKVE